MLASAAYAAAVIHFAGVEHDSLHLSSHQILLM
jgi:hypothetical protein